MLLQTNSYIVPAEKRTEHQRLIRRFRQVMLRLGCDMFEVYEQVGPNWAGGETTGRYVQILKFRDHQHQRAVQSAERSDPTAQALIAEFCDLINLPYQQQQGLFGVGFYRSVINVTEREHAHPQSQHEEVVAEQEPAGEREFVVDQAAEGEQQYGEQIPPNGQQVEQAGFEQHEPAAQAAPGEAHGGDSDLSGSVTFEDQEVEVEVEAQPEAEQPVGEQAGGQQESKPPLALDDLDLEALAQEELSQIREKEADRGRRRG